MNKKIRISFPPPAFKTPVFVGKSEAGVMRRSREFSEDGSEEGNIDLGLVGMYHNNSTPLEN